MATDVLGYLVQVVSGQPFDVFMHEQIFEPLGMVDTTFHVPAAKLDRLATNYQPTEDGGIEVANLTARLTDGKMILLTVPSFRYGLSVW